MVRVGGESGAGEISVTSSQEPGEADDYLTLKESSTVAHI